MFNQLSLFLAQNNILDNNQSGFRSGHSTETALLSVTEALRLARAASKSSVLILLDLSAAFDTVNHQILMSILRKMGISGTALLWFESYLSDRSFRVSWRGEVSKSQLLATGVPQGSVLGPLLFSIYMSSLGSVIQKHGFSYHSVFELYRGLWGSPLFYFFIFLTGGGGSCAYNDLQRYITATSVCTTCFMQALYRINHYTGFTLLFFIDTN